MESLPVSPPHPKRVLWLPELLHIIFAHIREDRAICNTILVNSVWFDCGTNVLWAVAPPSALEGISPARRQLYASKMTDLDFDADGATRQHEPFRHLRFTSLKSVSIDTYRPEGPLYLDQYLQLPLKSISIYGAGLDSGFFSRLNENCPRLQEVLLDAPGPMITPQLFLDFLKTAPSVVRVCFLYGMGHLLTKDALFQLAARPNLKTLRVGACLQTDLLERISAEIELPFRALEGLEAKLATRAVGQLVTMLPQLRELIIELQDSALNPLPSLAHLSDLRSLEVTFHEDAKVAARDVVALRKLTNLEELSLNPDQNEAWTSVPDFGDDSLERLVSSTPGLRVLHLNFLSPTSAALEIVSRHCRYLERLSVTGAFELDYSNVGNRGGVMFPNLKELSIGGFHLPVNTK